MTQELESVEGRVNDINEAFCDPQFFEKTSRQKVTKLEQEQRTLKARIDELMAQWQQIEDKLSELDRVPSSGNAA